MADSFTPDKPKDSFEPDSFTADKADSFEADSFTPDTQEAKPAVATEGGLVQGARISSQELEEIASKHPGVKPEELREWVNAYGGLTEDASLKDWAKSTAGAAAETFALGIPQFLAKKYQDETHERALDELSNLVDKKKSYLQAGSELAGGMFGSLKVAGKIVKAVPKLAKEYNVISAVGGGATSGVTHSESGEELKGGLFGGAVGAAIPAIGKVAGALEKAVIKPQAARKSLDTLISEASEKGAEKQAAGLKLIQDQPLSSEETRALIGPKEYESLLSSAEPEKAIQEKLAQRQATLQRETAGDADFLTLKRDLSPEQLAERYKKNYETKYYAEAAKKLGPVRPLLPIERWVSGLIDNKPVHNIVDSRLGSKLARTTDEASTRLNQVDNITDPLAKKVEALTQGGSLVKDAETIAEIESGKVMSPSAQGWQQVFGDLFKTAKELGIPLKERANYVTQARLPLEEYKIALLKRADEKGLKDPELLKELKAWGGDTVEEALDNVAQATPQQFRNLDVTAGVTKARDTVLPDFVREKSLPRLYNRWVNGIKTQYALQDHLDELAKATKVAELKGDTATAELLTRQADDIVGNTTDFLGDINRQKVNKYYGDLSEQIAQAKGFEKELLRDKAYLPRAVQGLNSLMYQNLLGLSPSAATTNLLSPISGAFTEQGMDYGSKLYTGAFLKMAKAKKAGQSLRGMTEAAGLVGPKDPTQILTKPALAYQEASKLRAIGKAGGKAAMSLFRETEDISRATVLFMGKQLAQDLVENPKLVESAIKSPAYKRYFTDRLASGASAQDLEQDAIKFLNGQTLLNFDKVNMSEYGRRVGPLLRTFTKYPTYHLGRIVQPFYTDGAKIGITEATTRYLAPLATFTMIDQAVQTDDNPTIQALTGSNGIRGLAAAASLQGVGKMGITSSPAVQAVGKTGKSLVKAAGQAAEGDLEEVGGTLKGALDNLLEIYLPSAGTLKTIDKVKQIQTNEKLDKEDKVIPRITSSLFGD